MSFFTKLSFAFKLLPIIVSEINPWHRRSDKIDVGVMIKYATVILKKYAWQMKNRGAEDKDICSLLDIIEEKNKYSREQSDRHWLELGTKEEIIKNLHKDIARFEKEVIHLKELVQEKNMIIDKLHEEKQSVLS